MAKLQTKILLSFDTEEFDMPLEYGYPISMQEQLETGKLGLERIINVLDEHKTPATFFTTAHFALSYPHHIKALSPFHEVASHTYFHSQFTEEHLLSSRKVLESITGHPIYGLRMPRMMPVSMQALQDAGYLYDSSINPTWLPGRYNNLSLPRQPYMDGAMLRLPASVTPLFRIPLFWLAFKNFPYRYYLHLVRYTLKRDGYICLYFHPWEFTAIKHGLPAYTRRGCGEPLLNRLNNLIADLKKDNTEFTTIHSFLTHTHAYKKD